VRVDGTLDSAFGDTGLGRAAVPVPEGDAGGQEGDRTATEHPVKTHVPDRPLALLDHGEHSALAHKLIAVSGGTPVRERGAKPVWELGTGGDVGRPGDARAERV